MFRDHILPCSDYYHTCLVTIIVIKPMKGGDKFVKEHVKPIDPSFTPLLYLIVE
jgi:hypothetical protein